MELNVKLVQLRDKSNLTQEELAEKLGVSRAAIAKWESGGGIPSIPNIIAISELFDVSIDYLLKSKY